MKQCSKCNQTLPLEAFYTHSAKRLLKSGRQVTYFYTRSKCIECMLAYDKFRKQNGAYRHPKYGVTTEQLSELLEKQEGACAICSIKEEDYGKTFCIDHCHTTGVVRGLLCMHCNTALGHFRDDIESLERAIQYLDKT